MAVQSYVIEIADEAVGIVIQERGGFRFFAASSACASLNRHVFTSVRGAERACRNLMTFRRMHAGRAERTSPADVRVQNFNSLHFRQSA